MYVHALHDNGGLNNSDELIEEGHVHEATTPPALPSTSDTHPLPANQSQFYSLDLMGLGNDDNDHAMHENAHDEIASQDVASGDSAGSSGSDNKQRSERGRPEGRASGSMADGSNGNDDSSSSVSLAKMANDGLTYPMNTPYTSAEKTRIAAIVRHNLGLASLDENGGLNNSDELIEEGHVHEATTTTALPSIPATDSKFPLNVRSPSEAELV